jgi:alkylation response protein AidB-like acyl-CoA dehydrogenase
MDFGLDGQQAALLDALDQLLRRHAELPIERRADRYYYNQPLDQALAESGYFDIPRTEGYGPVDATLVVEQLAKLPGVVEAGASLLVAPQLLPQDSRRPVCLISGDLSRSHRFLPQAQIALVDLGDEAAVLDLAGIEVEPSDAIFGYPYGRFAKVPDLAGARRLGGGSGERLRQWWRVAIAIEVAASMQAALDFTLAYVKERHVFGRAVGSFQAVQHRLAKNAQIARNLRYMALKAAWSGSEAEAALASAFGQRAIPRACFDFHQFNGAMGMTTEHSLHLWTMRLRALQSELGGADANAIAAAQAAWG